MQSESKGPTTVDEYLATFSPAVQSVLQQVRETIRAAAPEAIEKISYRMPSYHGHGALVYFGGFKEHVGLYPPVKDEALRVASARYAGPKGNLRFPLSEPMPFGLITRLVKARVREDRDHAKRVQAGRALAKRKAAK
jgi:uncharacterized protein YdhG (YjbR/CyaY superfamily)